MTTPDYSFWSDNPGSEAPTVSITLPTHAAGDLLLWTLQLAGDPTAPNTFTDPVLASSDWTQLFLIHTTRTEAPKFSLGGTFLCAYKICTSSAEAQPLITVDTNRSFVVTGLRVLAGSFRGVPAGLVDGGEKAATATATRADTPSPVSWSGHKDALILVYAGVSDVMYPTTMAGMVVGAATQEGANTLGTSGVLYYTTVDGLTGYTPAAYTANDNPIVAGTYTSPTHPMSFYLWGVGAFNESVSLQPKSTRLHIQELPYHVSERMDRA